MEAQALESKCHTGQTILYDTVTVKGWSVDVRTHSIVQIINKVLADPWPVQDDPDDGKSDKKEPQQGEGEEVEVAWADWWGVDWWGGDWWDADWWRAAWWGWGRKGPRKGKEPGDGDGDDGGEEDNGGWEKHGGVPKAKAEKDCVDCFRWYVVPDGQFTRDSVLIGVQGIWGWVG
jgi:lipase ATG15